MAGAAALGRRTSSGRISSPRQEQQPSAGAAAAAGAGSISSRHQEQQPPAGAAAAAIAAVRHKTKEIVVKRRASARALTLARSRGSEAEALRSPETVVPELEISWATEERDEPEEEEKEQEVEPEEEKESMEERKEPEEEKTEQEVAEEKEMPEEKKMAEEEERAEEKEVAEAKEEIEKRCPVCLSINPQPEKDEFSNFVRCFSCHTVH